MATQYPATDSELEALYYDRVTASDAKAQVNLGRIGSLVLDNGNKLHVGNLLYLYRLAAELADWREVVLVDIDRIEREVGRENLPI